MASNYQHPSKDYRLNDIHQSMEYDVGGRPAIRTNNFVFDVARGAIPGHSIVFLGGHNRSVSNNTEASIWNVGGLYPWSVWDSGAGNLSILSTNAADTGITLLLDGLDSDYRLQTEVLVGNGLTPVLSTKQFIRLNSATNIGNKAIVGTVNIRKNGTNVARITPEKQSTSMSIYTVPAGYTAFSVWGDFGILATASAELRAYWRFFGGVFIGIYATTITGQSYQATVPFPGKIPEKTDIDNRVAQGTNNLEASSNQQIVLIENTYL